jgi:hypothetical protein
MLKTFLQMVLGTLLVLLSFHLTFVSLKRLLKKMFPRRRLLHNVFSIIMFAFFQLIGIDLLIDPIVAGQAVIQVHAEALVLKAPVPDDLRIEMAVANFGGSLDSNNFYRGRFDESGIYTALVRFDWLQNHVRVKVYWQTKPNPPIEVRWYHISPWARLGLCDKNINISR